MQAKQEHLRKPLLTRFYLFFSTKKRRIFYLLFLGVLCYKWAGISNFFVSRRDHLVTKYKRRWIQKYNPHAILYSTPADFNYAPSTISRAAADTLAALYVRGDRQLKNGFSRQLTVNILARVMFFFFLTFQMGRMDDKQQKEFLGASGYRTMRKRMLCSSSMKEFLYLVE